MIFGLTGPTYDIGGAGPLLDENLLQNCRTPRFFQIVEARPSLYYIFQASRRSESELSQMN